MKTRMIALALVCCSTMTAQVSNYLGPGILSRGAGDIGVRGGQDVSLRFFVNATGIYDDGLQPYSLEPNGQLASVNGLWGTEIAVGAYGVHDFRHARLGLDYKGAYRHYNEKSSYDGTDHTMALGYTYQKSARLIFDMRQMAGTITQATSFAAALPAVVDSVVTPTSLLFDNRVDYLQSTLDVNYRKTDRTIFTVGGDGFGIWRKARGLVGMQGYMLRGAVQHRMSQRTTVAVSYQHTHYDFPKAFGQSDVNLFSGTWATQLGRWWTISVQGGAYQAEVEGLQRVAVDPEIAALLGFSSRVETFYRKSIFPQWDVTLSRKFQRANLAFGYQKGVSAGNGVYLTSRQEAASVSLSYTATRKVSVSVSGTYGKLDGIGQNLQPFAQISGGAGFTYAITRPIHIIAQYNARNQEVIDSAYKRISHSATFGISFSPADIPLSFH